VRSLPSRPASGRLLCLVLCLGAGSGPLLAQGGGKEPETAAEWNRAAVAALEAGRLDDAVADLERAVELAPEDPDIRRNLARALGHRARAALDGGRARAAVADLERGIALDRDGGRLEVLLAQARLGLGERAAARRHLEAVLRDFPEQADAAGLLADLEALEGRLEVAIALLERTLPRAADAARPALEARLARLREEARAWRGALTDSSPHFDVRYDASDPAVAAAVPGVMAAVEAAYDEVSEQLGLAPRDRLLVLVLARERYAAGAPAWSAALYDGRIRVAVGGEDPRRLRATLRHEYTHAALHRLGAPVPTWFHEGLAQRVEGADPAAARARLRRAGRQGWPAPAALNADWSAWQDARRVRLAYDYALSLVAWLEERYGSTAFRVLFEEVPRQGFADAFRHAFSQDVAALDAAHRHFLAASG